MPGVVAEGPTEKPARGRSRDTLYVHLTLTSRDRPTAALYGGVTDALVDAYFHSGGSVTAALRQAIRAANEYLMRHNLRAEGVDKQQGGITCAVLREEEVFLAQVGQALAFIGHQGRLERLPPRQQRHTTPLGVGYGLDTGFYHSWVHPGDVLLLAEPGFGEHADEEVGAAIIHTGVTAGIDGLAQVATADQDARLMLVEFAAGAERATPRAAGVPGVQVAALEPEPPVSRTPGREPRAAARRFVEIDVEGGARRVAAGTVSALSRLTGGVGRMLERLFEGRVVEGQAVKRDQGPPAAALGLLAVVIPIVVALIVVAVYSQRGRAAQFQDLLVQLDQESRRAQDASDDRASVRARWDRVLVLSDAALRLRPSHQTVLQFQGQARDALDLLDEVTRLTVHTLYSYSTTERTVALTVHGLAVYVLDGGLGRVYKHLLENDLQAVDGMEPETLLFKTQAVGADVIGELVDLTWFPKSGEIRDDTVAILDSTGLLLRYRPSWGDVISSRLVTPPGWSTPVAIGVYGDGFYVLDVGARQVWKFKALDGGYPEEPAAYPFEVNEDEDPTNDVDLGQMVDLAIDRDGHLFLLGSDGEVHKFFGGERKPFALTELQEPLVGPTAIFCSLAGLNPFFYIADPGSGRIVQTTQQGLFLAQYRAQAAELADPFVEIEGVYVQETPLLRIYASGGSNLIAASLE